MLRLILFVLNSCDVQIPAVLSQYSTLTKEQKEKIADGPGLEDFISEPAEEVSTPTAPLKSKSGERYFPDTMFGDIFLDKVVYDVIVITVLCLQLVDC